MPTVGQAFIDSAWTEAASGDTFEVVNPADTSEVVSEYPQCSATDAERAVSAASDAVDEWASMAGPDRGAILRRTGEELAARKDEVARMLTLEEGKTLSEAAPEVQRAIDIFHYYAQKARDIGGTVKSPSGGRDGLSTQREPMGVAGLITPWNYPIAIPAWKLAPALAAGNTAVLKPASLAPGPALAIFECLESAGLPAGVANAVPGPGREVGEELTTNDAIDVVSFTGSSSVGSRVYDSATGAGKRAQCEMGGKNPTVVMSSADVGRAADIVAAGAFGVTGQACTACSRAIVHDDLYEAFRTGITERATELSIGPGIEDAGMGPQVSADELKGTLDYIDVGREEGARVLVGGGRPSGDSTESGYFIEPTVLEGKPEMRVAQEEVFGPVLTLLRASDYSEAVRVANNVPFGLSASIVTQDLSEAHEFIDDVDAGVVKVNEKTTGLELHVPFGGYKDSSTNTYREQGDAGLDFFTTTKTVYMNH